MTGFRLLAFALLSWTVAVDAVRIFRTPHYGTKPLAGAISVEQLAPHFVSDPNVLLVAVRMWEASFLPQDKFLEGVELEYSNGVIVSHGAVAGDDFDSIVLQDGEFFTRATAWEFEGPLQASKSLRFMAMVTNKRRSVYAGSKQGTQFLADPGPGMEFIGIDTQWVPLNGLLTVQFVSRSVQTTPRILHFSEAHGRGSGRSFAAPHFLEDHTVQLLSVGMWGDTSAQEMVGIELEYSNGALVSWGRQSGTYKNMALPNGEYIEGAGGFTDANINYWWFQTNYGRRLEMGTASNTGKMVVDYMPETDQMNGTDCWGNDLDSPPQAVPGDYSHCLHLCRYKDVCTHWSSDGNSCWLKGGSCSAPNPRAGFVSGLKFSSKWELVGVSGSVFQKQLNRISVAFRARSELLATPVQLSKQVIPKLFSDTAPPVGKSFGNLTVARDLSKTVQIVRFWNYGTSHLQAVEFQYSDGTTLRAGVPWQTPIEFALAIDDGEYLMTADASSLIDASEITRLRFVTSYGRSIANFDDSDDDVVSTNVALTSPPSDGGIDWQIVGIRGSSSTRVQRLGVQWRVMSGLAEVVYQNMKLDWSKLEVLETYSSILAEATSENNSTASQSTTTSMAYETAMTNTMTDSFTQSHSLALAVGTSITIDNAFLDEGEKFNSWASLTGTTSTSTTKTNSIQNSVKRTLTFDFDLQSQPHTTVTGKAHGFFNKESVPYTADVHVTHKDGRKKVIHVSGHMVGTALHSAIEYTETPRSPWF